MDEGFSLTLFGWELVCLDLMRPHYQTLHLDLLAVAVVVLDAVAGAVDVDVVVVVQTDVSMLVVASAYQIKKKKQIVTQIHSELKTRRNHFTCSTSIGVGMGTGICGCWVGTSAGGGLFGIC